MVPVVLVILVVFQVPGLEIQILQEISSPELAGNRGKTKMRPKQCFCFVFDLFFVLFLLALVVLVVVLVLLGVVLV